MTWWAWIVGGLALLAAEVLTPGGLVLLFFGTAAVAVGLVTLALPELPGWAAWLVFSAGSVASLAAFRNPLLRRMNRGVAAAPIDSLVGETATATEAIAPGATGRVELRGTTWSAHNAGGSPIAAGDTVSVMSVRDLNLHVQGR